jgi:hypothetical protein
MRPADDRQPGPRQQLWRRTLRGRAFTRALLLAAIVGFGAVALQHSLAPGWGRALAFGDAAAAGAAGDPRSRLGAELVPLGDSRAGTLGLQPGTALLVLAVEPDSSAARAGLLPQDVITGLGAGTTASWGALCAALVQRADGGELHLFVRRDGRTLVLSLDLPPADLASGGLATAPLAAQTACV